MCGERTGRGARIVSRGVRRPGRCCPEEEAPCISGPGIVVPTCCSSAELGHLDVPRMNTLKKKLDPLKKSRGTTSQHVCVYVFVSERRATCITNLTINNKVCKHI